MKPDTHLNTAATDATPDILTVADLTCLAGQADDLLPFEADNACRAGAAAAALVTFAGVTGLRRGDASAAVLMTDLLAAVMHLCSETDLPFCDLLVTAGQHFDNEAG